MSVRARTVKSDEGMGALWRLPGLFLCGAILLAMIGCEDPNPRDPVPDADVTGTWNYPYVQDSPVFSLIQSGSVISGTYRQTSGQYPLSGSRQGNQITFVADFGYGYWMSFEGTVGEGEIRLTTRTPQGASSRVTLVRSE
jgi:hypothetical protein